MKRVIVFLTLWFLVTMGMTNLIVWHEIKKDHPEGSLFMKIRNSISKVLKHTEIDGHGIHIRINSGNNNGNGSNNSGNNNGTNINFGNINVGNDNGNGSNNSDNNSGNENNTSDND